MIEIKNLTLQRGLKVLLDQAALSLAPGRRVGLIGKNGSGKSSLFALLKGEITADKGDVSIPKHWKTAAVAQETPALDISALDYVLQGDGELQLFQTALHEAEAKNDGMKQAEYHAKLEEIDAYSAPARAAINEILHVIADFSATMPLVAFNGSFDLTVLYHEAQRNGLDSSAEFARIFAPESPLALIDGLTMHRQARPVWHGRRNLGALCKVYGVELGDNAHSAFHDARACAELSVTLTHEHPELFEVSAAELHRAQMGWYPAQMEELEAYLRRSREDETITCAREWPVRK